MAGLSIARRRKAWLKGVISGATGRTHCQYAVQKLREIFDHGVAYGRDHAETAYVKTIVGRERRHVAPRVVARPPARPVRRYRDRPMR
jgi:hypothetical protein